MSRYLPGSARSAVLGLFTALAALLAVSPFTQMLVGSDPSTSARAVPPAHRSAGPIGGPPSRAGAAPLPRSAPVRVSIPAIDATSSLMPLGLTADGTLQTPPVENPMQAGWYSLGPTPGEAGAAVIVGHVDGYNDPGIFYQLYKLKPGDQILIARQDGSTARFTVYRTEQVDKQRFPTDQVYATTPRAELRLITCGGIFNYGTGNYSDNIIVFAGLAAPG